MNQQAVNPAVSLEVAKKVLAVVNAGLVSGMGEPTPGKMCVEAAVCYAMDLPHSDRPSCVGEAVRRFKIRLNDSKWSSDAARTDGLRKLAIAQLGSDAIEQKAFANLVVKGTIQKIVPVALRAAAKLNPKFADELEVASVRCEVDGTGSAARDARDLARRVRAYASAYAAASASAAADASASAYAYADASAYAAASAAASASASADASASASAYADAYAYAAVDASAAADAAAYAAAQRDDILRIACQIGLEALIELKSPGCEFLYLVED